ncbi:MAG TPA: hypothetical protein VF041_23170 [Gemmatimonadaceae bacterium]
MDDAELERLVQRSMVIVRKVLDEQARIRDRARAMYRDMTGARVPLDALDEIDQRWWYRLARISLGLPVDDDD